MASFNGTIYLTTNLINYKVYVGQTVTNRKSYNRSYQEDSMLRIREIQKVAATKRIGSCHSKESKVKMIVTKFGVLKEIEVYKDGELINSCLLSTEASKITGVKPSAIRNNLSRLSKSAGGYVFKYKNIKQ